MLEILKSTDLLLEIAMTIVIINMIIKTTKLEKRIKQLEKDQLENIMDMIEIKGSQK